MQPSSYSDIVRRLRELGALADDEQAAAALTPTLEALGNLLTKQEREALAHALPSDLAQILRCCAQEAPGLAVSLEPPLCSSPLPLLDDPRVERDDLRGETKRLEVGVLPEECEARRKTTSRPGWRRLLWSL